MTQLLGLTWLLALSRKTPHMELVAKGSVENRIRIIKKVNYQKHKYNYIRISMINMIKTHNENVVQIQILCRF
jgi:hypothetical protein